MGNIHEFPVTPFSLPLNRAQFAAALRTGHGRAVMHVRQHGADGLEDLLIDACLHNKVYDTACECGRERWLVGMLDHAGRAEQKLLPVLLQAIREENADYSDAKQCATIVGIYAARGNRQAREAIYTAANVQAANGEAPDGAVIEAIIRMDDLAGLCHIAERIGRWLAANETAARSLYPTSVYDDIHGEGAALEALRIAAADNEWIAVFLDRPDPIRQSHERDSASGGRWTRETLRYATAEDIINSVETGRPALSVLNARHWGQHAGDDDVRKIAERLFVTSDVEHLRDYLRILAVRALPEFDERLLSYIDHSNERIRWAAVQAVAGNRHPSVRALAFECLRRGQHAQRELQLFVNNYEPGDWGTIRKWFHLPEDNDVRHWALDDLVDIFEANPLPEALEPLLLAYAYQPCGICRCSAVKLLIEQRLAPAWLIEECRDDADSGVRDAVSHTSSE